jgi:hypothetical protein
MLRGFRIELVSPLNPFLSWCRMAPLGFVMRRRARNSHYFNQKNYGRRIERKNFSSCKT